MGGRLAYIMLAGAAGYPHVGLVLPSLESLYWWTHDSLASLTIIVLIPPTARLGRERKEGPSGIVELPA
jgi:hypothetical protein